MSVCLSRSPTQSKSLLSSFAMLHSPEPAHMHTLEAKPPVELQTHSSKKTFKQPTRKPQLCAAQKPNVTCSNMSTGHDALGPKARLEAYVTMEFKPKTRMEQDTFDPSHAVFVAVGVPKSRIASLAGPPWITLHHCQKLYRKTHVRICSPRFDIF